MSRCLSFMVVWMGVGKLLVCYSSLPEIKLDAGDFGAWWILGALSNDPLVLSIYAAIYKVFGAAGAAIVFRLDNVETPYSAMFGSYWGLLSGSMICVLVLIVRRVNDSTETAENGFEVEVQVQEKLA
jgi:hypothetical protein